MIQNVSHNPVSTKSFLKKMKRQQHPVLVLKKKLSVILRKFKSLCVFFSFLRHIIEMLLSIFFCFWKQAGSLKSSAPNLLLVDPKTLFCHIKPTSVPTAEECGNSTQHVSWAVHMIFMGNWRSITISFIPNTSLSYVCNQGTQRPQGFYSAFNYLHQTSFDSTVLRSFFK